MLDGIISSIFGTDNVLYEFINVVCSIWNGFMDAAWALVSKTPAEVSPDGWNIANGSLMDLFMIVGASLLMIFFLIGYIQNALDLRDELTYEKVAALIFQLVVIEVIFLQVTRWIPSMCNAAKGLVRKVQLLGGAASSLHLSADSMSDIPWEDMGLLTITVGLLVGLLAFIVACVCGAIIIWCLLGRVFKIYILIPIAAVPLSTLAGGSRVQRPAVNWIREFLIEVFEVVVIALVLVIGASFIPSNPLASFFHFSDDSTLAKTCLGLFMMMLNMGMVTGAVKGSEAMLRGGFGA